ncbi:hypothetical protein ACHAW6_013376, partial [Cyclotella cf. meneghiniana]
MKQTITDQLPWKGSSQRNTKMNILAGVSDDFPLKLWDKVLPQVEITIDLLCQSNATPIVSAYTHFNGPFDYNKMPLALMTCNVQIHEKKEKHGTWAFHSVDGWYLNTLPEHYHMHKCHIKSTNSEYLSDTVHFHYKHMTNPTITLADKLMNVLANCKHALLGFTSNKHNSELKQIEQLLHTTNQHIQSNAPSTQPPPRIILPFQDSQWPQQPPRKHTPGTLTMPKPIAPIQLPKHAYSITRSAPKHRKCKMSQPDFTSPAMNAQSRMAAKYTAPPTLPPQLKPLVDDFGVKYVGQEHALHLKSILEEHYTLSTDWKGTRYIGLSLDWEYTQRRVHLSMPGYVSQALKQFQLHKPSSPQHQPFS